LKYHREGFDSFLKIGLTFAEVRYGRLYRATHDTFESYCQTRWALSLSRYNQIARTLAVYDNIASAILRDAALLADANEHTLRPLTMFGPELQSLAWQLIRRIKEEPDAMLVEEVVETIKAAVATGWQERAPILPLRCSRQVRPLRCILARRYSSSRCSANGAGSARGPPRMP
jgi:hypothetical protein